MTPVAEEGLGEGLELEGRIPDLGGGSLRHHAARGVIINAVFQIGLAVLTLSRRMLVAVFLTPAELGVWGIVIITVMTLFFLKNSSISDKFVQQSDADQESAFQRALTFELGVTFLFVALVAILMPVFAAIYGQPEIVLPGLVMLLAVLGNSLQAPTWVFYRRMAFRRQRTLQAIDPCVAFVVTIALAAAGAGYWSLIIGFVVGSWVGALFAIRACPYRMRLRIDRAGIRDYFAFSWPLFIAGVGGIVVAQGSVLVGSQAVGIAGIGAISLAASVAAFSDGVDGIVTQTLYPAICAVRDRTDLLFESFVKSNRLALMWGMPFGLGLALFASDLVHFGLGEKWHSAIVVLQAFGLIAAFDQLGFNWSAFLRARNDTRPMAVVAGVTMAAFILVAAPLLAIYGLPGYAAGMLALTATVLVVRTYFLGRLFSGFRMIRHCLRAVAPSLPAVGVVLALKLLLPSGSLAVALGELLLYVAITVAATLFFERDLLREIRGYLRRPVAEAPSWA